MGNEEEKRNTVQLDYKLFTELWRLFKRYSTQYPVDWPLLVDEISQLNTSDFAGQMIQAVLMELERREKDEKIKRERKDC